MSVSVYQASPIKRSRSTAAEVERRRVGLLEIIAKMRPMTVRQVYYQATVRNLVDKTEAGYARVQTDLVLMRRAGVLPYDWLADNTRWQRKPTTFSSVEAALDDTAKFYRKALWYEIDAYVEIWLEKDALAGVVLPITSKYDVPLMVARGYASLSFLHSAAEYINDLSSPVFIYHLGDFDPSGVNAGEKIEQTLREMAPEADITFKRIAVNADQIRAMDLPTRPTKTSDTRSKNFGDISVELDAIPPDVLRNIVQEVIEDHLPPRQFSVLKAAEESERAILGSLIANLTGGEPMNTSDTLTAAIAQAPDHMKPVFTAIRDYGIGYAIIIQDAGPFTIPLNRPTFIQIGDDLQTAKGPDAFDAVSMLRIIRQCEAAFIIASGAEFKTYALACYAPVQLGKHVILVETLPAREDEWVDFITEAKPDIRLTISKVDPNERPQPQTWGCA